MELTILEMLYIILIMFIGVIGTLLIIALMRLVKILGVIQEITGFYTKIKQMILAYGKIPEIVKDKVKEKFSSKNTEK